MSPTWGWSAIPFRRRVRSSIFGARPSITRSCAKISRLANPAAAARFFGGYSEVLELKHDDHTALFRRPNVFSVETPEGSVFLRCSGAECLVAEGTTSAVFEDMTNSIGWAPMPVADPTALGGKGVIAAAPPPSLPAIPSEKSASGL